MIFFREHRFLVRTQKNPDQTAQGFFMLVRADFKGPVDSESGMILNLKDVDHVMKKMMKSNLVYKSHRDFVVSVWRGLRNSFPRHIKCVQLTYKNQSWIFDGKSWKYVYRTHSRFAEPQGEVSRLVVLESATPFKAAWIKLFRSRVWKNSMSCVQNLKLLNAPLKHVQIEKPEWKGWEKWYLD